MTTATDQPAEKQSPAEPPPHPDAPRASDIVRGPLVPGRETVESIVVALFLALLLRAFEAEAFVIPTGSMAPTLMGRHKDLDCSECGFNFQAGASREEDDQSHTLRTELAKLDREVTRLRQLAGDSSAGPQQREVARRQLAVIEAEDGKLALLRLRLAGKMIASATCPNCSNVMRLIEGQGTEIRYDARYPSFDGDRILVDKFAYDFADPQRWDVVVFKYPEDSDTNYIKRLVGLPGETVQLVGGDVWTSRDGEPAVIARKPPQVMRAMLQTVHDSDHPASLMQDEGWPPAWTDWADPAAAGGRWQAADRRRSFSARCATGESARLRFRHFSPRPDDWKQARLGQALDLPARPDPVDDFQAYNAIHHDGHWVGDLAIACQLESRGASGVIELDLVDGGRRHRCIIDLASGLTELAAADGPTARAQTAVQGVGRWQLLFANVDDQLRLFVDDSPVVFDQPVIWQMPLAEAAARRPLLEAIVPGDRQASDLSPVGITLTASDRAAEVAVSALRVLRDGFYIGAVGVGRRGEIRERAVLSFPLEADQFFVLGDNSAASKDGRLWSDVYHVDRRLLIGRAVAIFWPHMMPAAWHVTVKLPWLGEVRLPSWPNFARMRAIR